MPAIELQPLPEGWRAALERCRFVTTNMARDRAWAWTNSEEDAQLLGGSTRYRRSTEPLIYEHEVSITHPDGVAIVAELQEARRG